MLRPRFRSLPRLEAAGDRSGLLALIGLKFKLRVPDPAPGADPWFLASPGPGPAWVFQSFTDSASQRQPTGIGWPCARNTIPRGRLTGDTGIAGSSRRAVRIRAPPRAPAELEQCRPSTAAMTRCPRGIVVCFTGLRQAVHGERAACSVPVLAASWVRSP